MAIPIIPDASADNCPSAPQGGQRVAGPVGPPRVVPDTLLLDSLKSEFRGELRASQAKIQASISGIQAQLAALISQDALRRLLAQPPKEAVPPNPFWSLCLLPHSRQKRGREGEKRNITQNAIPDLSLNGAHAGEGTRHPRRPSTRPRLSSGHPPSLRSEMRTEAMIPRYSTQSRRVMGDPASSQPTSVLLSLSAMADLAPSPSPQLERLARPGPGLRFTNQYLSGFGGLAQPGHAASYIF